MKFIKFLSIVTSVIVSLNILTINVSANENDTTLKDLTVSEAVEKAIVYSSKLKTLTEDEILNEISYDDSVFELRTASENNEYTSLAVKIKELNNKFSNNKVNTEIEKQSIELSIIEFFSSVIEAQNSLELYEKNISLSEKQLKISEVKLKLGKISETAYNAEKVNYDKLIKQKTEKEASINNAFYSLNKVLGEDLKTRYNLVLDIEYTPLGDTDLEYYVLKAKSSAQSIVEKEQAAEIAKYQLDRYAVLYTEGSKESRQNAYAQSQRALDEAKTTLELNIRTLYTDIVKSESDYETALIELEKLNSDYKILQKKYELGKATSVELEEAELNILEKEISIQTAIYNHDIMVRKYNNVNLIY